MRLAELLVAMAVLTGSLGAALGALEQGQTAYGFGAARVETQQTARAALARLAAEIRGAGRGTAVAGLPAIGVAEPARLVLHHDLDGNGVIAGNGETITWRLAGTILRRDAGGGAQPIANGVRALRFAYEDAAGLPTTVPADVASITITLTTVPDHARSHAGRAIESTAHTTVRLRNR
jgi:hypothetical protein